MLKQLILSSLLVASPLGVQGAARPMVQADLDALVAQTRTAFNVPGIAVAIVKDGEVVASKGFGLRKLGESAPVTPRTLFSIASNTKAFTAVALAILVDEGKLAWDDRVVDRLPGFQMSDPYVTREMTIRDLLCHRSGLGLGSGDLLFFPQTDFTTQEILYRLRFIPLSTSFRSSFAYDNILYTVAGEVIRQVSGTPWAEFIRTRIFKPLGMASSRTSILDVRPGDEVAAPHAMDGGKLVPLPQMPLDNSAPCGAIVSSVEDLAKWVITLLKHGELTSGKRLFSEAQARVLWTPLTLMPTSTPPPELAELKANFKTYAMGEYVQDYRGHRLIWHDGGLQGVVTAIAMLPEQNLGIIVLTNQEVVPAYAAIRNSILDHYLEAPAKSWVHSYQAFLKHRDAMEKEEAASEAGLRNATSRPSLPLKAYAGRYRDPWYGDILVEAKADQLSIRFTHSPLLAGTLEHWQYDTFVARWQDRSQNADAFVSFALDPDGKVEQVRMKAVSSSTDFSFDFQDLALSPVADGVPPH